MFCNVDFLLKKLVIGTMVTRMRTQPVKLIRNSKHSCPLRRKQKRVTYMPVTSRINLHLRVVKGR
jgi:hypothetical protein